MDREERELHQTTRIAGTICLCTALIVAAFAACIIHGHNAEVSVAQANVTVAQAKAAEAKAATDRAMFESMKRPCAEKP